MVSRFLTETVTVVRPGAPTRDSRGNDVPGTPTETVVTSCGVFPPTGQTAPTVELTDGRQTVEIIRVLYAPIGTDIRATDRVRHGSVTYEVAGAPSPFAATSLAHVEATLREVTG